MRSYSTHSAPLVLHLDLPKSTATYGTNRTGLGGAVSSAEKQTKLLPLGVRQINGKEKQRLHSHTQEQILPMINTVI